MPAEKRERRAEITYILCIACLVPPPLHSFVTSSFCLPAISTIFHSKNPLHDASVLSSLLAADFCLTRHSPVFVCNTALLYTVFFCSVRSYYPLVFQSSASPTRPVLSLLRHLWFWSQYAMLHAYFTMHAILVL